MKKQFVGSLLTAFLLSSSLYAQPVASGEIKQFAAQALQIDYDKAPVDIQKKITEEYTQRLKLAQILVVKLKNDSEFVRVSQTVALDLWSKRIADATKPSDADLKKAFSESKDLKIAPSYKLRHIMVNQESLADDLIAQLNQKTGMEKSQLFTTLAASKSLDQTTKQKGGELGWIDANALPMTVNNALKEKQTGSVIKLPGRDSMWDVLLIDEVKPEHTASFEEAKNFLTHKARQKAIETEARKLLGNK